MSDSPAQRAIEAAGGLSKMAAGLGLTYQAVKKWGVNDRIPTERVPAVSQLTGIPRHELRPDLPELFPHPDKSEAA